MSKTALDRAGNVVRVHTGNRILPIAICGILPFIDFHVVDISHRIEYVDQTENFWHTPKHNAHPSARALGVGLLASVILSISRGF